MNTIEAYEHWLQDGGYQPTTVANYGKALATLHTQGGTSLPIIALYVAAVRAFLRWDGRVQSPGLVAEAQTFDARVREAAAAPTSRVAARRAAQARRKREARSLGPDDFTRLADVTWSDAVTGSPEAAVLSVMYATGLRVGDALAITRRALVEGKQHSIIRLTVKGGDERLLPWAGAEAEWRLLSDLFAGLPANIVTVADLVVGKPGASTHAGGAAYMRVYRALKVYAGIVGIRERIYLHRLRRTVAVRALTETRDIAAVQQLLGHRSIQTTSRYVDEARPEALAGLQQSINPRRKT